MTVVHFSVARGRPPSLRWAPSSPRDRWTWCSWTLPLSPFWPSAPTLDPWIPPSVHGGSPTRGDVAELVRRGRPHDATYVELPAAFAQRWRELREEEARKAAEPAFEDFKRRYGHLMRPITAPPLERPEWAALLDLSWPAFTEAELSAAWKAKAFEAHPDRGGSHDAFVALEGARRAALTHLGAA